MLTSSLEVSATMMSASAAPALSSTVGWAALPATVRTSSRSCRSRSTSSFRSTTVDRKSTRLNSSHSQISYAVFCLKKKKTNLLLRDEHEYKHYTDVCSCLVEQ